MELIKEISNATDNKKHAIGVFIDLKKAFNTVEHKILVSLIEMECIYYTVLCFYHI